ncbi:MAG TPA: S4 domain-containing protein, partial [Ktedonobacterales bacterium]|nr:S4 domain-containing protein [Ktedonobacterales bacterium]
MAIEQPTSYTVEAADAGTRLDRYLARVRADLSRTRAQALIARGLVRVAGKVARASLALEAGQRVEVDAEAPAPAAPPLRAEIIPVPVIYEDDHLLVIDKPAGLVVHPAPGHQSGTLVNALLGRLAPVADPEAAHRPGLVHRLEKDPSGLMV